MHAEPEPQNSPVPFSNRTPPYRDLPPQFVEAHIPAHITDIRNTKSRGLHITFEVPASCRSQGLMLWDAIGSLITLHCTRYTPADEDLGPFYRGHPHTD